MRITSLIAIENSHIVGYKLDKTDFLWLTELKERIKSKPTKFQNAKLNKYNHIEITDEANLPIEVITDLFESELLIYATSKREAPAYYNKAIFQYNFNEKPIKIDPDYFSEFESNSDKFKPFVFTNSTPITEMRFLFKNISLINIDLSNLDTRLVVDMTGMFNYVATHVLDVSTIDTSNVTTMRLMFSQCNIQKLDLSSFNMANTTDISRMFANATIGELIMPKINIDHLNEDEGIFEYAEINILNLNLLDLSTVKNIKKIIKILYKCQTRISTIAYKNAHHDIENLLTSDWSKLID